MTWTLDESCEVWTASDDDVILEVWREGRWAFSVMLLGGLSLDSLHCYQSADAAKSAAEHALAIWRKGEAA